MVRNPDKTRKRAFKAALAWAGQTAEAWCADHDITRSHLYAVLSGQRESAKLTAEIDAFIQKHTPRIVAA